MSPEQLTILQRLSQLFEEGMAGPKQIKELSELLASINHAKIDEGSSEFDLASISNRFIS